MNKTNLLLGAVGVVALVIAILALSKPAQVIVEKVSNLGAIPGDSIDSQYFTQGGQTTFKQRQPVVATSTSAGIICAIRAPQNATSTLTLGKVALTIGTTTATRMTLAKSATQYATTTVLNSQILNARDTLTLFASSSPTSPGTTLTISDRMIFAPGQWFTVSLEGGSGGAASTYDGIAGACNTIFELN